MVAALLSVLCVVCVLLIQLCAALQKPDVTLTRTDTFIQKTTCSINKRVHMLKVKEDDQIQAELHTGLNRPQSPRNRSVAMQGAMGSSKSWLMVAMEECHCLDALIGQDFWKCIADGVDDPNSLQTHCFPVHRWDWKWGKAGDERKDSIRVKFEYGSDTKVIIVRRGELTNGVMMLFKLDPLILYRWHETAHHLSLTLFLPQQPDLAVRIKSCEVVLEAGNVEPCPFQVKESNKTPTYSHITKNSGFRITVGIGVVFVVGTVVAILTY